MFGKRYEAARSAARAQAHAAERQLDAQWDVARRNNPDVRREKMPLFGAYVAARHHRGRYEAPVVLVGLLRLVASGAFAYVIFWAAGGNYVNWFLSNGALIATITLLLSLTVDLDSRPELISGNPWMFTAGVSGVAASLMLQLSAMFSRAEPDWHLEQTNRDAFVSYLRWWHVDRIATYAVSFVLAAVLAAWVLLVAPLQYVVTLVCGAPARSALAASKVVWEWGPPGWDSPEGVPDGVIHVVHREVGLRGERPAPTSRQITLANKPVSLTYGLSALFLLGIQHLV